MSGYTHTYICPLSIYTNTHTHTVRLKATEFDYSEQINQSINFLKMP